MIKRNTELKKILLKSIPGKDLSSFVPIGKKTEPVTRHIARRLSFDGRAYGLLNRRVIAVGAVKLHRCAQSK
jgi:hypothetical protein